MKKCPKCGSYLAFHMEYWAGQPAIVWTCSCGYSTSEICGPATDHTDVIRGNMTTTNRTERK